MELLYNRLRKNKSNNLSPLFAGCTVYRPIPSICPPQCQTSCSEVCPSNCCVATPLIVPGYYCRCLKYYVWHRCSVYVGKCVSNDQERINRQTGKRLVQPLGYVNFAKVIFRPVRRQKLNSSSFYSVLKKNSTVDISIFCIV